MAIINSSNPSQWFWCPGELKTADLLNRAGCSAQSINSPFWLNGSFISSPEKSWPTKPCSELIHTNTDLISVKIIQMAANEDTIDSYIHSLIVKAQSVVKVKNALLCLSKAIRRKISSSGRSCNPWSTSQSNITKLILQFIQPENLKYLSTYKLKGLVTVIDNGIWYVGDRSFRSRLGIPLVASNTTLATYIVQDAHKQLGHARDWLQMRTHIYASYFIPGVRNLINKEKKNCGGCARINPKSFQAFEKDVPDNLSKSNAPFTYCQADIFGPETISLDNSSTKRWILVVMCLSSRAIHLEKLNSYSAASVNMAFIRTFATRGTPRTVWIDAGLNIVKAARDIQSQRTRLIPDLNMKFPETEFRAALPKHHESIGGVERIIGIIKNTVSKSLTPPSRLIMSEEEFSTWLSKVIEIVNNRPLILGLPTGDTITPNHLLHGFPRSYTGEENLTSQPINQQLQRWKNALYVFGQYWHQEFAKRRYTVAWKSQVLIPKIGDLVLFLNEPIYPHTHTLGRITSLLTGTSGDIYGAKVQYKRSIGERYREIECHLHQLYPFMDPELQSTTTEVCNLLPDNLPNEVIEAPSSINLPTQIQDEI